MTNATDRPVEIGQGEVWVSDRERFEATATPEQLELADALTKRLEELGHHDIASRRALLLDLVTGVIARHAASAREEALKEAADFLFGEAAGALADEAERDSFVLTNAAHAIKALSIAGRAA